MQRKYNFFQVSGTLGTDAPSYIERHADTQLIEALKNGELCLVLAPRQTGKSSLMVHAKADLEKSGFFIGFVDFQALISQMNPDTWFSAIVYQIERSIKINIDSLEWWDKFNRLIPSQRFMKFMEEVILNEVDGQVVIFFDEIDSVLSLPFSDIFFNTIRSLYNARANNPILKRLNFVLLGVSTPSEFIKDSTRTPFNIGKEIKLTDFEPNRLGSFRNVLGKKSGPVINRIFYWTSGQPQMVQKLSESVYLWDETARTPENLDYIVKNTYLNVQIENDSHLNFIRDYLLENQYKKQILKIYKDILDNRKIPFDDQSLIHSRLLLSGVATVKNNYLFSRNLIYKKIFSREWVKNHMFRDGSSVAPEVSNVIFSAIIAIDQEIVKKQFVTLYNELKYFIDQRLGKDSDLSKAIISLEKKPYSKARQLFVMEECIDIGTDLEIIKITNELFKLLEKNYKEEKPKADESHIVIVSNTKAKIEGGIHHGDRIDIDSGKNTIFAKDQGIALVIEALNLTIEEKTNIRQTLRRYLSDLAAKTNLLPWGQLSPEQAGPEQGENLRLSDVYTALDTTEPERMDCEEDIRECLFHREKQKRISAQQMANDHERLVLLGDPGSGKTTLVNFLTHIMACTGTEKEPDVFIERLKKNGKWDHGSLFPLRILLRDFAAWMEKNPDRNSDTGAFVRNSLKEDGYDDFWPFIHEGLQNREVSFLVLLDGLDEVPADIRGKIVSIISNFTETYPYNRYIVTCRIYAYIDPAFHLPKFRQTVLAPFTEEQIHSFTDAWYSELAEQKRKSRAEAQKLADSLKSAVRRPELLALAQRPLIMTVMALLHTSYGQLPEDRVELYKWATDLLFRRWQGQTKGEKSLMAALDMPQLRMRDLEAGLYYMAFYVHSGHNYAEGPADIPEEMLLRLLRSYLGNNWNKAEIFVHYIRERAGLLIRHKTDAYTFPNRTFQEFMSACHITGLKDYPREAARLVYQEPDRWRVVFVLAAGHAARTHQLGNAIASVAKLCPASIFETGKPPDRAAFGKAVISGEALLEIGLVGVNREKDGQIILDRVRAWLLAAMQADNVLRSEERVEAGNVLSQLGDPRFDPENWYLPVGKDMGFVTVPAGPFLMGSDREKDKDSKAYDDEFPQHRVELSEYRIARYLVTVAQFRAFVKDSGFEPGNKACLKGMASHPVVWISWYEATAYCRWLTEKLESQGKDCRISLPTEAQWEKAARGTEGLIYPWGDQTVEPDRANYDDIGIGTTSPVGCFPDDASPYNCMDMAGNVWEWCQDWFDEKYYSKTPAVDPVNAGEGALRVFRGGSWHDSAQFCRSASRSRGVPDFRRGGLGFRLVLFPGQQVQQAGRMRSTEAKETDERANTAMKKKSDDMAGPG